MPPAQFDHPARAPDEHVDQFVGCPLLGLGVSAGQGVPAPLHRQLPVVGRVGPPGSLGGRPGGDLRTGGRAYRLPAHQVREVSGGRTAQPDLQRMDIGLAVDQADIRQHLGGVVDRRQRGEGVRPADQPEIGHRVQFEQKGTGDLEEVADRQIATPGMKQGGQRVEYIEGAVAVLGQDLVNRRGEALETQIGIEFVGVHPIEFLQQRLMAGEPDVAQPTALGDRPIGERTHQPAVLR